MQGITSDYPTGYRFGIELEYLIRPKNFDERPQNRDSARDHLVQQWNEKMKNKLGFIPMESGYQNSSVDLKTRYAKWRLVDESLLNNDNSDVNKWALELVSPIFRYDECDNWIKYISLVIGFLVNNAELEMNEKCGFHIHISPIEEEWNLDWLKHIATAIIVVDDDLKSLFNNDPRQQELCFRSNKRANPLLRGLNRGNISALIADCQTIERLIDLINANTGKQWDQRNYAWNFTGLAKDKDYPGHAKNTLEFRSPRATTDMNTIIKWIVFVVTFVHASVSGREVSYYDIDPDKFKFDDFLVMNHPPGRTDSLCWENYKEI